MANAYKNSYNIISDFANVKFPIQGSIDQAKMLCNIPATTLAAFSCELFMKSMLYAENTSVIRLHDLSELFKNCNLKRKDKYEKTLVQSMLLYLTNK